MADFTTASGSIISAECDDSGMWAAGGVSVGPYTEAQAAAFFAVFVPHGEIALPTPVSEPVPDAPMPDPTITLAQLDAVLSARGLTIEQSAALFAACAAT